MNIDSISNRVRTFLLSKNIIANTIKDNGLSSLLENTIGKFANISSTPPNVIDSPSLETLGESYLELSIINNQYQPPIDEYRKVSIFYDPSKIKKTINSTYDINDADLIKSNKKYYDYSIIKNKFSSSIPDYETASIGTNIVITQNLEEYDISDAHIVEKSKDYLKFNTTKNKFLDQSKQLLASMVLNPTYTIENTTNYLDDTYEIFQNIKRNPVSVINGILGGLLPTFSVGTTNPVFSYMAMIDGSVNAKKDTKLGIIAAHSLAFAIRANTAANLYEETIGNINQNPINLINGGPVWIRNYSITVAKGTFGSILDYGERILGFNVPVSLLSTSASIFDRENSVATIQRVNNMLGNTGKGQVYSLMFNANANMLNTTQTKKGYTLSYSDPRDSSVGVIGDVYILKTNDGGFVDMLHGNENNPISQSNYNLDKLIKDSGFDTISDKTVDDVNTNTTIPFIWGVNSKNFSEKSLLGKTQLLFNQGKTKMKTLMTEKYYLSNKSEINSSVVDSNGASYSSRGSAVIKYNGLTPETDPEKMFFRTFTKGDQYSRVKNLQKHSGLNKNAGVNQRFGDTNNSVLNENGIVDITPYFDSKLGINDPKKYMFSIENLAWNDNLTQLIDEEIGNGDPITGKKGRIMWFPPYDINFTDNTSVDWEKTSFIGRGEPIYTYNNTTRTGTLDFKIIIDHPAYLNNLQGEDDQLLTSFFSGGFDIDERVRSRLSISEQVEEELSGNKQIEEYVNTPQQPPKDFSVYFPCDVPPQQALQTVFDSYETGLFPDGTEINYTQSPDGSLPIPFLGYGPYVTVTNQTYYSETNFGLNKQFNTDNLQNFINEYTDGINQQCPACKVILTYYGQDYEDNSVVEGRVNEFINFFEGSCVQSSANPIGLSRYEKKLGSISQNAPTNWTVANTINQKQLRKIDVSFQWDPVLASKLNPTVNNPISNPLNPTNITKKLNSGIKNRLYSEAYYFQKLSQTDKFAFDTISEKIKFFNPSFHSITPEGFNSRLTFLQQCTRQGPTYSIEGVNTTQNLAFGDAPICILRIGDFYNTKIVIDSLNYTFDPLVWDMNPEGIGVQPMICNVTISFAFLGGSDLTGPITKLQNAVSFNYFANTSLYDPRSDINEKGAMVKSGGNTLNTENEGYENKSSDINQEEQTIIYNGPLYPPSGQ